jgi:hypothetical protein
MHNIIMFAKVFALAALPYLFCFFIAVSELQAQVSFEPVAGWTHTPTRGDDANYGVPAFSPIGYSSPVVAEIDGNTANGKEVAVGSQDGTLAVFASNGALLWKAKTPNAACNENPFHMFSSPAVGELYGDGIPYVVVGYGGIVARGCDGGVVAFRGSDGARAWVFSTRKLARARKIKERNYSVYSTPSLADVDNDGKLEVAFGSFARYVFLLEHNGKPRMYYHTADTVWSSPSYADIDGDGRLELLIGTDISRNDRIKPKTKNGGFILALRTRKRPSPRLGFRSSEGLIWSKAFDQTIFSSPSVGDIIPSSPGLELAVGSGCYFGNAPRKPGKWLKVIRLSDGAIIQTLPTTACSSSSPALADIENDGDLEVFSITDGSGKHGGDGMCRVAAWSGDSTTPLWNVVVTDAGKNDTNCADLRSPIVADLDGNGSLEVAVAIKNSVIVLNAATGASLTCENGCGSTDHRPRIRLLGPLQSTPAVGDLNSDGVLDLVVGGRYRSRGMVFAFTGLSFSSPAGPHASYAAPWAMFRANAARTGRIQ